MAYTNSSLVNCTVKSPNHSGLRNHSIDRITPHCVVGQLSAEGIGNCFPSGRKASCNYGIGYDGRVCLIVDERNRSWCSSSSANDHRAITIECASDATSPYAFKTACYNKLVLLCADICKRNGKTKLIWIADKTTALKYSPASNEMLLTVHRWFANKSCPGDWMYSRMGDLAAKVNNILGTVESTTPSTDTDELYRIQCGAFEKEANAKQYLSKIKEAGFDAFIVKVGGYYKIQCGAFKEKANADKMLSKITSAGFDAFITKGDGSQVIIGSQSKKSVVEIAQEIYNGKCSDSRWSTWGTGNTRKERLELAGYNYSEVQAEVNKLFK